MNVLFATMQYARGYAQGTERYISILADGLRQSGHEVAVLAGDPERRDRARRLGEAVAVEPPVRHLQTHGWMAVRGDSPERLEPLIRELRPDLLHVTNPAHIGVGVMAAARRCGVPVVATVVDYWWLCPKHTLYHYQNGICDGRVAWTECLRCIAAEREDSARQRAARTGGLAARALPLLYIGRWLSRGVSPAEIHRWTRRRAYLLGALRQCASVIFLSDTAQALLKPELGDTPTARITNGLEEHWFAARRERGPVADVAEPDLRLVYAGAIAPHKGLADLLEALHRLGWRQAQLIVAGGGEPGSYQERIASLSRGLNVDLRGRVKPSEMPALIAGAHAVIVPSRWPENLPMVVLESLACGTPVLASRVGGVAEILADEQSLFEPGNPASLADCLDRWRRSGAGRRYPTPPRAAEMVAATMAVYRRVLART